MRLALRRSGLTRLLSPVDVCSYGRVFVGRLASHILSLIFIRPYSIMVSASLKDIVLATVNR